MATTNHKCKRGSNRIWMSRSSLCLHMEGQHNSVGALSELAHRTHRMACCACFLSHTLSDFPGERIRIVVELSSWWISCLNSLIWSYAASILSMIAENGEFVNTFAFLPAATDRFLVVNIEMFGRHTFFSPLLPTVRIPEKFQWFSSLNFSPLKWRRHHSIMPHFKVFSPCFYCIITFLSL